MATVQELQQCIDGVISRYGATEPWTEEHRHTLGVLIAEAVQTIMPTEDEVEPEEVCGATDSRDWECRKPKHKGRHRYAPKPVDNPLTSIRLPYYDVVTRVREGDAVTILGEKGRFKFNAYTKSLETGKESVLVVGGTTGHFRAFPPASLQQR